MAPDPVLNYQVIQKELLAYGHGLADRVQIVALNKTDAIAPETLAQISIDLQSHCEQPILNISAVTQQGLETLLQKVWIALDRSKQQSIQAEKVAAVLL
jgi:GTPase